VPLSIFAGNNLELDPTDLPQGLSPDSRDVAFLPGSVLTRPAARRFNTRAGITQAVYAHDYVRPDGTVSLLTFYSDGAMLCDGVQFGQTQAGNRFQVASCFGKAFIAVSDGLHGVDVPLQWDGTNLDRVSQDGPGAPVALANYSIPAVTLVTGSAGSPVAITSITPIDPEDVQTGGGNDDPGGYNPPTFQTYYTSLYVVAAAAHGLSVGESVTIAGNSLYNLTGYVSIVDSATVFEVACFLPSNTVGTGGTVTSSAPFLQRSGNEVTATTADPHNLQAGYQAAVSGVADQVIGGSVSSIVVDNTAHPGLARITTTLPHGLSPGETLTLSGVTNVTVGTSIVSIVHLNGTATLTTTSAHNLQAGAYILVQSSGGPFLPFTVSSITSPTVFSYTDGIASGTQTGGSVVLVWPGNQNVSESFTVESVDSATSFFVPLNYSNGTWTSGTLTYTWNGTFYVTSTPSATTLTYRQVGPDLILTAGTGMLTPAGQIEPGDRSAVVLFLTRAGYLTKPSVKVSISANGGKYLAVSQVPIGPPNTAQRVIAFPGANGGNYFYLPTAPRDPTGSYLIGTSTVIPDNTTTSAIFDFADASLFNGIAIDIPGNNLFGLEVLGPCLGFFTYASRLIAWGDRNRIQQFRNMGFEGGVYAGAPNVPLGWNVVGSGTLAAADYGMGWKITGGGTGTDGKISQGAYLDTFGVPILKPLTQYTFRLWLGGAGSAKAEFYSPTSGVLASATVVAGSGGWAQADFSAATPVGIPTDTVLNVYASGLGAGQTLTLDELQIIYTKDPFLRTARVSYVNNPESFHGVTGKMGIANFPLPIMAMDERKDSLCLLTAGPLGALYETDDTASGEPSTWNVRHIASLCGVNSVWGVAKFEDWFVWASDTGMRIYDGGSVDKLSQEIQAWWNSINPAAKQVMFVANDPYIRRLYIGAPTGTATVPDDMYVLDYRELNTSNLLANAGTLKVGYSGKMVATDLTRKWTPWTMTMNFCGMVSLATGGAQMLFCGGTGGSLSDVWHGTIYTLEEGVLSGLDDDYGPFWQTSTYPTYFFLSQDEAAQYKLGSHRLLHAFATMNVDGVGTVFLKASADRVDNVMQTTRAVAITANLARDLEFGLQVRAERVCYRICCQPAGVQPFAPTSPAGFHVSSLTIALKDDPYAPVRGRNG